MEKFRHRLAFTDALPQLTIAGLICGILAAVLIVCFRILIDTPLSLLLPENSERFEALNGYWRFGLPLIGGIILGTSLHFIDKKYRDISVSHVLERLHKYQGLLPIPNLILQFFGGIICLISGQSLGREGPAVHIGAATASQFGQWLKLPNNSLRTLIACGVASAIAASFDTPMAGVIFAMEVVLMEYTIIGFIPVILASVSGAVIAQIVFGQENSFYISSAGINSLWEFPYMMFAGLIISVCSAIFIRLVIVFHSFEGYPIHYRLTFAGFLTGLLAIYVPEILGMGYDTVSSAMLGEISIALLMIIVAAKTLATAASVGLGMPAGLIGPCLVLGACIGGSLGLLGNTIFTDQAANIALYVTLGMVAMMAAVLNAPLAALIAILELSSNPNIIFPGMLMIVVACFATRQFFQCDGIFQEQLKAAGKPLQQQPAQQLLSRIGVRSVMNTSFIRCQTQIRFDEVQTMLDKEPLWVLAEKSNGPIFILRASNLATHIENLPPEDLEADLIIDLNEIPGERFTLLAIPEQANLFEAQELLKHTASDALYVIRRTNKHDAYAPILGIITKDTIHNRYRA